MKILSRKFLSFHWLAVMWEHSQPLSYRSRCLIRKWVVLGYIIGRGTTLSIYGSAHYTLYSWLVFRLGAEPFLLHPINLLLVIDRRIYWASFILRNNKGIDFSRRWPLTDTTSRVSWRFNLLLRVHPATRFVVWGSPFSVRPFYEITKWDDLQISDLRSLSPFTKSPLYVATVAPSCRESPFIKNHSEWLCYPATTLLPISIN